MKKRRFPVGAPLAASLAVLPILALVTYGYIKGENSSVDWENATSKGLANNIGFAVGLSVGLLVFILAQFAVNLVIFCGLLWKSPFPDPSSALATACWLTMISIASGFAFGAVLFMAFVALGTGIQPPQLYWLTLSYGGAFALGAFGAHFARASHHRKQQAEVADVFAP